MLTASPERLVLDGVPRVHFYQGGPRCPEDLCFPSVMRAVMEFLQDEQLGCKCRGLAAGCKVSCSYSFFIGVTGTAAFLSWKPGWSMDNQDIMYMSDDPAAPFVRALRAVGWSYDLMGRDFGHDEATCRLAIVESLQRGRPVIAFGPIGPPEACLITGYDDGGDVLIGWSFFQGSAEDNAGAEFEPSGQFRKRDWFTYADGFSCLVLDEQTQRPPLKQTFREALQWMLQVTRTPRTYGYRHNGLAAYEAWAEHLLRDEDFPAGDEAALRQRHEVHHAMVGLLAEARWYGSQFLVNASDPGVLHHNLSADLLHAAAHYATEHELMWRVWDLAGGIGNRDAWQRFADPAVRRQMAPLIRRAGEEDAQAAVHIAAALAK
jgi:hypothetical protein